MKKDEEKSTEFMHGSSTCIGQRNGGDGGDIDRGCDLGNTHKVWNPKEHAYEEQKDEGTWSNQENANKVTITNSSNTAVTASITVQMRADSTGLTATPADTSLKLEDASIGADTTTPGKATTAFTTISLAGDLADRDADSKVIGSVVVTISDTVQQ